MQNLADIPADNRGSTRIGMDVDPHYGLIGPSFFVIVHHNQPVQPSQTPSSSGARIISDGPVPRCAGFLAALCFENASQEGPRRRGQSLKTTTECSERNRPFSWPQVSIGHAGLTIYKLRPLAGVTRAQSNGRARFRSLDETSDFWSWRHLEVSIRSPSPDPTPIEVFRS